MSADESAVEELDKKNVDKAKRPLIMMPPMAVMARVIDPSLKKILFSDQKTYKLVNKRNMAPITFCNKDTNRFTNQLVDLQTLTIDELTDMIQKLQNCYKYFKGTTIRDTNCYSSSIQQFKVLNVFFYDYL